MAPPVGNVLESNSAIYIDSCLQHHDAVAENSDLGFLDIIPSSELAVGGAATEYAISKESRIRDNGEIKFGRPKPTGRVRWSRSLHFDGPHGDYPFPHLNGDFGPIKWLKWNHKPIPNWLYTIGNERVLRPLGRSVAVVGAALDIRKIAKATPEERPQVVGEVVGAWGMGAVGATYGSYLWPGPGTIAGAVVGAMFGDTIGGWVGGRL